MFTFAPTHQSGFAPASQFLTDLTTGNLPSVAEIEPGFAAGLDEHAGSTQLPIEQDPDRLEIRLHTDQCPDEESLLERLGVHSHLGRRGRIL